MPTDQQTQLPPLFRELIAELGEEPAKAYLRRFYAQSENLPAFAMLFKGHVPTYPPEFHVEILEHYTGTTGNVAGAAPRGFAKSTVTSLVYAAWRMLNATSRFTVLISDTYTQAVDLGAGLKDEMEENEHIRWLYGDVVGDTWAEDDILIMGISATGKRLPCRMIMLGAGMKVRGRKFKNFRPQLVIIDDLENDEAVASKERRAKLRRWLLRAVMPAVDRVVGRVIMIGTILHKRSLLNAMINHEDEFAGWHTFKFSAIKADGTSLWPEVYTIAKLRAMQNDPKDSDYIGLIAFAQEMQNNPLDEGQQIIQEAWLENGYKLDTLLNSFLHTVLKPGEEPREDYDILGEWLRVHFKAIHASVDPAISEKETADFWAMITIGVTRICPVCGDGEGHILVLDYVQMRESDPMKQVDAVIENYELWQQDRIRVEAVAYQAGLVKLIKREAAAQGIYLPLKPFRPLVSKVRRMNVHAANFSGGLVHLRQDHPLYAKFKEQLLEFPQGEHDDMVDGYMGAADVSLKRRTGRHNRPTTSEKE